MHSMQHAKYINMHLIYSVHKLLVPTEHLICYYIQHITYEMGTHISSRLLYIVHTCVYLSLVVYSTVSRAGMYCMYIIFPVYANHRVTRVLALSAF